MFCHIKRGLAASSSATLLFAALSSPSLAQSAAPASHGATPLPEIDVIQPQRAPHPARRPKTQTAARARRGAATASPQHDAQTTAQTAAQAVAAKHAGFDAARQTIFAPNGASAFDVNHEAILALPQGANATLDKVLLQAPGVSQDSAASGDLHVRNEHANVQYRINGIALPDGVSGFGQMLDTSLVGRLTLLTGALPAQYGLRTAGVVDITTRTDAFNNGGTVSVYGGSRQTITPSVEYGGTAGETQYFVSGRYFGTGLGLENPTSSPNAIHDDSQQGRGFAYLSTVIDDTTRLTFIGGGSANNYQIPNNPGQTPGFTAFGVSNFNSAQLNETQQERNSFGVLALQKSINGLDLQLSAFSRYSTLHFMPDTVGDLVFNGVASDVYRRSVASGIQADGSYRLSDAHTLRGGFQVTAEQSRVTNSSVVLPLDDSGNPLDAPFSVVDSSSKLGWLFSTYLQDEWRVTNTVTLNSGLRFDQMNEYTNANQLSPRISLTWKPTEDTTFHAGYSRNFTPPAQVLAAPTNLALVQNTTQQPAVNASSPVLPERSNVFDVGVTQKLLPGLEVGIDTYYKTARDLLDDGQFGAAYVLSAFNYDRAENVGIEFKGAYTNGNFRVYGNLALARQIATKVVSNQYLFDPDELAYIASNYIYTDHAQLVTASAGASYRWHDTNFSASMIYGSGLRSGFANIGSLPSYTQVNLGVSHDFYLVSATKPTTVRFDVVNLFDSVYEIRDGSGIGVFAPQYGPRRGFYVGVAQKF
ncbi:Vitamin B12 transporter BtuB [Rhodopseudomonas palustris]|uniref:Possible ferrichrome-iron receptor n=1 Tax=Rhodopseudomonas palustris (strain ATCC BAA-98 / CGA009) TaxID=258594 RepID=Q6N1L8_RHOPA|nr:ligand-gated channel [Rhodopseudomonas palustris]QQM05953.1 Vitamin B12 transporter BtuB [Rhodopseudomonas palustris]RJF65233.1 ligand-gated channel [Rhodopseudomonas palustris]CAE29828.1 possible ferrichrome-iron receptor [Rhodopseudomonas palustris CGA009]